MCDGTGEGAETRPPHAKFLLPSQCAAIFLCANILLPSSPVMAADELYIAFESAPQVSRDEALFHVPAVWHGCCRVPILA